MQGVKAIQIEWMPRVASAAFCFLAMTGCGPSDKQRAAGAEEQRVQCLDKLCYGDVIPKFDSSKDEILKLNEQWYVGPKEYFCQQRLNIDTVFEHAATQY